MSLWTAFSLISLRCPVREQRYYLQAPRAAYFSRGAARRRLYKHAVKVGERLANGLTLKSCYPVDRTVRFGDVIGLRRTNVRKLRRVKFRGWPKSRSESCCQSERKLAVSYWRSPGSVSELFIALCWTLPHALSHLTCIVFYNSILSNSTVCYFIV